MTPRQRLKILHEELDACRRCPQMIGPVVHGPPVMSKILLIGQAPGPREGSFGRPFAWTAGKTLFRWLESVLGAGEAAVRERIYMAAVARCFPGKAKSGGDRKPDPDEIEHCKTYLEREVEILAPELVIPVGGLAIEQVLGRKGPLADVVGRMERVVYLGASVDVIALPHPSGASTWHRVEPGLTLLPKALALLAKHEVVRSTFGLSSRKSAPKARAIAEER